MKRKIFLLLTVMTLMICILAISVSAENPVFDYDESRQVVLKNGESVSVYDNAGNALSYYTDGTEIKSVLTTDIVKWNSSGWLEYKSDCGIASGNIVVLNLQDPTLDKTAFSNYGINTDKAFRDSANLECVLFSNIIQKFNGMYYFAECPNLKVFEITEESMLKSFGNYTFYDDDSLLELYIPAGVKELPESNSMGYGFISKCESLTTVIFAQDSILEKVGESAFFGDTSLVNIVLPDSVKTVKSNAFRASGIINSPFTENSLCETIESNVFYECKSLKNFIFPKNIISTQNETSSSGGMFSGCTALETVIFLPDSKTESLGRKTFIGCTSLKNVTLPASLKELKGNVFDNCTSITEIIIPNGIEVIGCTNFSGTSITSMTLPDHIEYLGSRTFQGMSKLEYVKFGANFKGFIKDSNNHSTFYQSNNVKTIVLPKSFVAANMETNLDHTFPDGSPTFIYTGTLEEFENLKVLFSKASNNGAIAGATAENGRIIIKNHCEVYYNNEHSVDSEYVFTSFTENTYVEGVCVNCGQKEITETYGPIVVISGASYSDNDIMYNYSVNKTAIEKYIASGRTLSFGVVVALGDVTSPLNADGTLADGVGGYASNLTDRGNDLYEIAVKGIPAEHLATSLVCCGYITDGTTLHYMGATSLEETSTPVTLEALIALTPAEIKEEY